MFDATGLSDEDLERAQAELHRRIAERAARASEESGRRYREMRAKPICASDADTIWRVTQDTGTGYDMGLSLGLYRGHLVDVAVALAARPLLLAFPQGGTAFPQQMAGWDVDDDPTWDHGNRLGGWFSFEEVPEAKVTPAMVGVISRDHLPCAPRAMIEIYEGFLGDPMKGAGTEEVRAELERFLGVAGIEVKKPHGWRTVAMVPRRP